MMYYRTKQYTHFAQILNEGLKDVDKRQNAHLFNTPDDRLAALNALASYNIILSQTEKHDEEFTKLN
jgi:hypothetical protein